MVWQDEVLPFTLAHPAAVLPLRRTWLVFSALVIGSVMPDVPYFFTLADNIRWGHSLGGVFLFCLPAGLVLLWLFHAVIKRPLVALAPESIRVRIAADDLEFPFGPWSRFLLIVGSLLIGIFTHILWDGFTHEHGYFVKHWVRLSTRVPSPLHRGTTPLWRLAQHGCSVLGILVLAMVVLWWWWRKPVLGNPVAADYSSAQRHGIIAAGIILACALGIAGGWVFEGRHHWKGLIIESVIVAISAGCAEIFLFSITWQLSHRKKEKPRDREIQELNVSAER